MAVTSGMVKTVAPTRDLLRVPISGSANDYCGSGLARESVGSVNITAGCTDAIASKLAPTGYSVIFSKLR